MSSGVCQGVKEGRKKVVVVVPRVFASVSVLDAHVTLGHDTTLPHLTLRCATARYTLIDITYRYTTSHDKLANPTHSALRHFLSGFFTQRYSAFQCNVIFHSLLLPVCTTHHLYSKMKSVSNKIIHGKLFLSSPSPHH